MSGKFITFEGTEGSGKTTIIKEVAKYLELKGYNYITTREPGGIKIAEQIRNVILDIDNTEMDPKCEALLYAASRRQHIVEKIKPALEKNLIILCDRYIDSSLAYQGIARGIGYESVLEINRFAIENYMPDLTIYIDVKPEIGLKRVFSNKDRDVNRLDLEKLEFHNLVYNAYGKICDLFSNRIKKVDGNNSIDKVVLDVIKKIDSVL